MNRDEVLADLSPFSDLGTASPKIAEKDGILTAKLQRDGRPVKISINVETGKAQAVFGTNPTRYFSSFEQLLAAEGFANLRRWADAQRDYLRATSVSVSDLIPVQAKYNNNDSLQSIEEIDSLIGRPRLAEDSAEIVLLDGPAGIGKTTLIEQLALKRAEGYRTTTKPLLLHVKSRGRVLSNLQDLMAFSLQTLRLTITYDQVPVLVKHGLVVLAIDGFDELGDPSGYELAWGQVNEIVTSVRGQGIVILSGRDTFIGRDRLIRDVKAIRKDKDTVTEVSLDAPTPEQAKEWLKRSGQWTDASFSIPAVSVLLEPYSYALRPVFLRLLREQIKPKEIKVKSEGDLTALLVNHMVDRESQKFGDAVENVVGIGNLRLFVNEFLKEAARDMADSQSESLDAAALMWIAEAALGSTYPDEVLSLIKNRVGVLAFLADDERVGHKKFSHVQIMNFFLAQVTLASIASGDIPKFVRRNILGREFLSSFCELAAARAGSEDGLVSKFISESLNFSRAYAQTDRGIKNIGALLFASLPALATGQEILINGYQIDEAIIRGTAERARVENVAISQLDIRGADLTALVFDSSSVVALIANDGTRVPESFPNVSIITDGLANQIDSSDDVSIWLDAHGRKQSSDGGFNVGGLEHPAVKLLGRACRLRQYWLRSDGDEIAARILKDPWWELVSEQLDKFGYLRKEVDRQASGRSSTFFHIKQSERLLDMESDSNVRDLYKAIWLAATSN